MKVSQLIQWLQGLPDHHILIQKDSEGNSYRHPTGVSLAYISPMDFNEFEPEFVYDDPDGEPENYMELVVIW